MRELSDGDRWHGPDATALMVDAVANGTSIVSGCTPSKGTGDSVDVSSGTAAVNGSEVSFAGDTASISSRDTFERYDLVTIDSTGAVASVTGSSELTAPDIPADEVLVAIVFVPADSDGSSISVLDARIVLSEVVADTMAARTADFTSITTDNLTVENTLTPPKYTSDPTASAGDVWFREDKD